MSHSTLLGLALLCSCSWDAAAMRSQEKVEDLLKDEDVLTEEEIAGDVSDEELPGWFKNTFTQNTEPDDLRDHFEHSNFEDIARVRGPEMGFTGAVASALLKKYSDRPSNISLKTLTSRLAQIPDGVKLETWKEIGPVAMALDNICKANAKSCKDGALTYEGFMQAKKTDGWRLKATRRRRKKLAGDADAKQIYSWLKSRGYWKRRNLAKALAKAAVSDPGSIEVFVNLDDNRRGTLSIAELMEYLEPAADFDTTKGFFDLATVQAGDFKKLGLPKELTKSIMNTVNTDAITKKQWEEFALQPVITDFLRRDEIGPENAHKAVKRARKFDDLDGKLKFYQIADAFPHLFQEMDGDRNAIVEIDGKQEKVHVPDMKEITHDSGRLELSADDLENWLIRDNKMSNGNRILGAFTKKWSYAKELATNAMIWADGAGSDSNARISGADEWVNLAGRLALYLEVDKDHDGELTFEEAYPYLKSSLQSGLPGDVVAPSRGGPWQDLREALELGRAATTTAEKTKALAALVAPLKEMELHMAKVYTLQEQLKEDTKVHTD